MTTGISKLFHPLTFCCFTLEQIHTRAKQKALTCLPASFKVKSKLNRRDVFFKKLALLLEHSTILLERGEEREGESEKGKSKVENERGRERKAGNSLSIYIF